MIGEWAHQALSQYAWYRKVCGGHWERWATSRPRFSSMCDGPCLVCEGDWIQVPWWEHCGTNPGELRECEDYGPVR